jgi:cell fate regulator YaaT (PSP1 superfamily)
VVSLAGPLVRRQMIRKGLNPDSEEIKKVYRRAKPADIDKWKSAIESEDSTKKKARQFAAGLKLNMKINDVEYQGDKTKAIFYYTAEERVDFRELIKVMADAFQIRIEMRQIGVRQEASRLGGTGTCGRELCCATWMSEFKSVTTASARSQQLSLNPQKLAGQCGKLKCCLNFEYDTYLDALKDFPDTRKSLQTKAGDASHVKSDIFKRKMWYSYQNDSGKMVALDTEQVNSIIEMNRKGELPPDLEHFTQVAEPKAINENILNQDDLHRFDNKKKSRKKRRR